MPSQTTLKSFKGGKQKDFFYLNLNGAIDFLYHKNREPIFSCKENSQIRDCKGMPLSFDCEGSIRNKIDNMQTISARYTLNVTPRTLKAEYCQDYKDISFDFDHVFSDCKVTWESHAFLQDYLNTPLNDSRLIEDAAFYKNAYFASKYALIATGLGGLMYSVYKMIPIYKHKEEVGPNMDDFIKFMGFWALGMGSVVGSFYLQSFIPGRII